MEVSSQRSPPRNKELEEPPMCHLPSEQSLTLPWRIHAHENRELAWAEWVRRAAADTARAGGTHVVRLVHAVAPGSRDRLPRPVAAAYPAHVNSIFQAASHGPVAHPLTHDKGEPAQSKWVRRAAADTAKCAKTRYVRAGGANPHRLFSERMLQTAATSSSAPAAFRPAWSTVITW